jgi:hypothetical protein
VTQQRKRPQGEDKATQPVRGGARVQALAEERGWTIEAALDGTFVLRDANGTLMAANWAREGFGLSLEELEKALQSE